MCTPAIFAPELSWSLFPSTAESLSLLKLPLDWHSSTPPPPGIRTIFHICVGLCGQYYLSPSGALRLSRQCFFFLFLPTSDIVFSPLCSIPPVSARALFLKSAADLSCTCLVWLELSPLQPHSFSLEANEHEQIIRQGFHVGSLCSEIASVLSSVVSGVGFSPFICIPSPHWYPLKVILEVFLIFILSFFPHYPVQRRRIRIETQQRRMAMLPLGLCYLHPLYHL